MTDASDHDPTLEPYASMTKLELLSVMERTETQDEWEWLNEHMLDKMTTHEMETHNRAMTIGTYLIGLYGAEGNAQCLYLCQLAGRLATEIAEGMPPLGPPELVN